MPCDACGIGFVLPDSFEADCNIITKDCGVERMYAYLCDFQLDTLDQESIDAAVTAGQLKPLPLGNATITPSTGTPLKVSCSKEIPGKTIYTIKFVSASRDDSNEDFLFWQQIYATKLNLTLLWKSCDGLWFINPAWSLWVNAGSLPATEPDEPLGIEVSFTEIPNLVRDEANEICSWNMSWQFKLNDVLIAVPLPTITL